MNLIEALFQSVREQDRWAETAILYEDRALTYEQLYGQARACGALWKTLGLAPGDRVAILAQDCPEWVVAFLGAAAAGVVAVPLSTMLTRDELAYVLDHSGARALLATPEQLEKLESIRGTLKELEHVLAAHGTGGAGVIDFQDALAAHGEGDIRPVADDALAFILYTSGSTGRPKGAMHTHGNLPYTLHTCCRNVLKIEAGDRIFSSSKLFFAYGLGNSLTFPLGSGAATILCRERPLPPVVAEIFRRFRPTVFFGVPAVYRSLLAHARDGHELETASIKFCVSAGEKLPEGIFHEWKERFGLDILDGIGSTEMLQMFISNTLDWIKPGSSGRVIPGYEARLVDQSGQEVPGAGTGNLMIRGGSSTAGYWRDALKTAAAFDGEWMRTGDIYRRDEDSFYWFEGRSDDLFKIKGLWVSPVEVEDALLAANEVLEAAVVAGTSADGTTEVLAFVVLRTDAALADDRLAEKLQAHARTLLPSYKCPAKIHFTNQLPRTATGKLQRYKLREGP